MPVDVFENHDRIVHHHADQQQQRQHGERIEGVAEEVDDGDGAHQRNRNGECDDQRRAQRTQEQPDHGSGEEGALEQMLLERPHDLQNEQRVVGNDGQLEAGRKLRANLVVDPRLDALDDFDRVGIGDLDQTEADCRPALETGELTEIRQAVFDLRQIGQSNCQSIALRDDQLLEIFDLVEFQIELDQVLGRAADHEAAR